MLWANGAVGWRVEDEPKHDGIGVMEDDEDDEEEDEDEMVVLVDMVFIVVTVEVISGVLKRLLDEITGLFFFCSIDLIGPSVE